MASEPFTAAEIEELRERDRAYRNGSSSSNSSNSSTRKPQIEWPRLHEDALYGLAGRYVEDLKKYTEADPAFVLLNFLTIFGCLIDSKPHYMTGRVKQHTNLSLVG